MAGKRAEVRVGMSGWTYEGWKDHFYPKGLSSKGELPFAASRVNSIEVNGTFYRNQTPATFENWFSQVPEDFVFSIKGGQFITHVLRLKGAEQPLANFFASGILKLEHKLGPVLWQLPPFLPFKDDRFEKFVKLLPKTFAEASRLAQGHSEKMQGRACVETSFDGPIRHAIEVRHPSFQSPKFLSMLRRHGVAIVQAHAGKKSPFFEERTADFVYARLHGQESAQKNGYSKKAIADWCKKAVRWRAENHDVFIYFDNDEKETAPFNAMELLSRLRAEEVPSVRRKAVAKEAA